MEPLAALGFASAIVTFLELSNQVVKRVDELSNVGDVPRVFRDAKARLPLVSSIVTSIRDSHDTYSPDIQQNIDIVIIDCLDLVKQLHELLDKVTVKDGDSKWRKGVKAVVSFGEEGRVKRISIALREHINALTSLKVSIAKPEEKPRRPSLAKYLSAEPPSYDQIENHFLVPFKRDDHFVGRSKVLEEIDLVLRQQSRVSVAGMGGVGKSQVAIEYAYRYRSAHPEAHVFWVYGASLARFYQGYKRIAQRLNLPSWDDPDVDVLEIVSEWFNSTSSRFLLILDNADKISDYWPGKYEFSPQTGAPITNLSTYLPNDRGKLLVTSRDLRVAKRLMRAGNPITLQTLTATEAAQLFAVRSHLEADEDSRPAVIELVRALDCLPLAISQAASFIGENGITLDEYLSALRDNDPEEFLNEELDDARRDEESLNSAFRAWRVSFDQIVAQKPVAADLLCLMAMFDRQNIPRWLINVPGVALSLGILQSFHMVTARSEPGTFLLHRLTQLFVQTYLKKTGKIEDWKNASLSCLSSSYPTEIGIEQWPVCEALAPHVQYVTRSTPTSTAAQLDFANILCWAADFDIERGLFVSALAGAKRSLELFKSLVPEHDERLASAEWLYGRLMYYEATSENDVRAAEAHLQRSLRTSNRLTLVHAESAFELAYIYYSEDREEECLKMARESFETWDNIGGSGSVRTLDNRHDYAIQLAMFGREEEAIANWQEILRLAPQSDAVEKTKTVFIYRSMACIAEFQDDYQLAEDLNAQLVAHCSAIYNPTHVHVFDYQLIQAEQILRQGRYEEALEIAGTVLGRCESKSEWRVTTSCYQVKAECYRLTGQLEEELKLRHEILDILRKMLGPKHNDAYDAMEAVARCFIRQNKGADAAKICSEILDGRNTNLGPNHVDTLTAMHLVAICKLQQDDNTAAEDLLAGIFDRSPDAITSALVENMCIALWNQPKWAELTVWCRRGLELQDADSSKLQALLVTALEKDGKGDEAMASQVKFLNVGEESKPTNVSLQLQLPPFQVVERHRFGRVIHPRTWSS